MVPIILTQPYLHRVSTGRLDCVDSEVMSSLDGESDTSGMDVLSSCFLRLVQDAPALPVCRTFVATATVSPGVNPLEPDVPPKSRCRTSTAVPI